VAVVDHVLVVDADHATAREQYVERLHLVALVTDDADCHEVAR